MGMKIVNRETFLELPNGIAFSKYSPKDNCSSEYFEELSIKLKTCKDDEGNNIDFHEMGLSNTKSFSRDGLFEEEQLFAVFENEDIDEMIAWLNAAKTINNGLNG